ncbi:MAG: TIGR03619 family F420-dependent LLM class oxidoreductase [Hyphomicrobiaceae bacterium]|nr:TIGR03619 family F420-dependent LLM class oxidoreductase [Hyphomicrobiaceae bacterium]
MDFGLHLGTRGAAAHPDNLVRLAQHADALGLAHLGFSDHVVIARKIDSRYPYNESGDWPGVATGFCLEQLSCLAYAAAVTKRIRLLTSVMVIPHRPAVLTAKALATIDVLSAGRVTVGVGVGWMAEEMAALGSAPPYERRGAASNEYIRAFRTLWAEAAPAFDGEFVKFRDIMFEPKPVQRPGPPIWVGGEGTAAQKRAVALGDGWYPTIRNPKEPLDDPARFAAALADVHKHCAATGRDTATLDVAIFAPGYALGKAQTGRDGRRVTFTGSADEIAADASAFRAAGVRHINIGFESNDLAEAMDKIEGLAREVMPRVR